MIMTVKEFSKALADYPPDAIVVLLGEFEGEFSEAKIENKGELGPSHSFIDRRGVAKDRTGSKIVIVD